MAAIALPLIASAAPDLIKGAIDIIAQLVHKHAPVAQASGNPGPVKFADVFVAVQQALVNAHAAGQIPAVPDDNFTKVVIQSVVTALKLPGMLLSDSPAPAVQSVPTVSGQTISLKSGQTLIVSVA